MSSEDDDIRLGKKAERFLFAIICAFLIGYAIFLYYVTENLSDVQQDYQSQSFHSPAPSAKTMPQLWGTDAFAQDIPMSGLRRL